jgi:hypothetical protein
MYFGIGIVERIKLTTEQYFPYKGRSQIFFPVGSEGFVIRDPVEIRGLPEQEVLDFMAKCKKDRTIPILLENQLIPLDVDDFESREVIREVETEGEEKHEDKYGSS